MSRQVLGRAGGSAGDGGSWAKNADVARIGSKGEQRTAKLLAQFAQGESGVTLLHDLAIPIPNIRANIDHVVVAGRRVFIIDTKVWRPGVYWTLRGTTRRGWGRVPHVDSAAMSMAFDALNRHLAHTNARVQRPIVAVWPSSGAAPLRLGLCQVPGARVMRMDKFSRFARRTFSQVRSGADPDVVRALALLLKG